MPERGEVILCRIQFVDTFEIKTRPALVLFCELGNIIVAGITSNTQMKGIPLLKEEGAIKDSTIKLNYIFTISHEMVKKQLFKIDTQKWSLVKKELLRRLD